MEARVILVTGGGGKTGLAVIRALKAEGESVRALLHHSRSVGQARAAGADQTLVGDLENPADLDAALASVKSVYAVCPNMAPDELGMMTGLVESAWRQGLRRLVYHSVLHPQTEAMPHHWQKLRVEERLFESGLDVTILQPAAYMQNIKGYWSQAVSHGVYRVPYPRHTRLSLVDLQDVASAAAVVLTQPGHVGACYELCGPEAQNQDQVARAMSRAIGAPVEAEEIAVDDWLALPGSQAMRPYQRKTLASMFRYYAEFGLVGNPNVLTWLIGRPPRTLDAVLARDFSLPT